MTSNNGCIEKRLWDAAHEPRTTDYSQPVLGLIFLRFLSLRHERLSTRLEALIRDRPDLLEPDRRQLIPWPGVHRGRAVRAAARGAVGR